MATLIPIFRACAGYCGSTCAQMTTMSYLYSVNNPAAPSFRFATFGGTGKPEDISVTW